MSDENMRQEALWFMLVDLPPEVRTHLRDLVRMSETREEFVSAVMVGPCPRCGSNKTGDDDDFRVLDLDPGDVTVGVCAGCGYLWCLDCGAALEKWPCPHWEAWENYCNLNDVDQDDDQRYQTWLQQYSERSKA